MQIPSKWIEKRLTNAEDRALVHAMFEELQATGRVEATLPEDDRVVRDLYALQVAEPAADRQAAARAKRVAKADAAPVPPARPAAAPKVQTPKAPTPKPPPARPTASRPHLSASDDLEAAPSIGPRSAEWFAEIGIFTVGEFLAAEPAKTAEALGQRSVTAATISVWQKQARLVMDVPGLRGTHAQLLVGAGYTDAAAVAAADRATLCAAVLHFAASPEGQRILRKGEPPSTDKIMGWVDSAALRAAA